MKRKINIIGLTLFFTLTLFSLAFSEESMTITTYYPSPYGSYNELTTTGNTYLATTSGNVGIGTANPGEKLEVAGNVKATAFIATTPGAGAYKYNTSSNMIVPDYVFAPNYSLMPLDELKKFVEKNRYLPGISSAEELKKNGTASLVEQYLKNLEKIEELYLYVFQLEQRIKQLEQSNVFQLEQRIKQLEQSRWGRSPKYHP